MEGQNAWELEGMAHVGANGEGIDGGGYGPGLSKLADALGVRGAELSLREEQEDLLAHMEPDDFAQEAILDLLERAVGEAGVEDEPRLTDAVHDRICDVFAGVVADERVLTAMILTEMTLSNEDMSTLRSAL